MSRDRRRPPGGGDGSEMRFLDEVEAETRLIDRLGRGAADAGVYDAGYSDDDPEDDSGPVQIFVGRARKPPPRQVPSGPASVHHWAESVLSESESWDDELDDEIIAAADDEDLGALPTVGSEVEELDSLSLAEILAGASFGEDDDEDDFDDDYDEFDDAVAPVAPVGLRVGRGPSRPAHHPDADRPPMGFRLQASPQPVSGELPVGPADERSLEDAPSGPRSLRRRGGGSIWDEPSQADTGSWNRLDLLGSDASSSEDGRRERFGVVPEERERPSEEVSGGWDASPLWSTDPVGSEEPSSAPPPILATRSSLQAELESRVPLEPKAVVLKRLDGIPERDSLSADGFTDPPMGRRFRDGPSEQPSSRLRERETDSSRVRVQLDVQPADAPGAGRAVVVALALLLFVGGVGYVGWDRFPDTRAVALEPPPPPPPPIAAADAKLTAEAKPAAPDTPDPEPEAPAAPEPAAPPAAPPVDVAEEAARTEQEASQRESSRADRRDTVRDGLLRVVSDVPARVYVDGRRVDGDLLSRGIELAPGNYDVKVVPNGIGRPYRTETRVDEGRPRTIQVTFKR